MNQKKEDHQWRKPFVLINISVTPESAPGGEADRLIEAGKVLVDGQTASMGMKVAPGQTVVCDGKIRRRKGQACIPGGQQAQGDRVYHL